MSDQGNTGDPANAVGLSPSVEPVPVSPPYGASIPIAPIPREVLDRSVRTLCRHIASQIIAAMSETDTSVAALAERLGVSARILRRNINMLIDGRDPYPDGLAWVAYIAHAMGYRVDVSFSPLAQGIEAGTGETEGLDAQRESPVGKADAPKEYP